MNIPRFGGDRIEAARELVAEGQVVEITGGPEASAGSQGRWPRDVTESVGECAVVPRSCLEGKDFQRYPLLVGPKGTMRFLCADADPLPVPPFPYESAPVRRNYRAFRDLWVTPPSPEPELSLYENGRGGTHVVAFFWEVGELLAALHSRHVLHGDAHVDNFGVLPDGSVRVGDNHAAFLWCPPSPAQCATDIYPLLPSLNPTRWRDVSYSYLSTWPQGQRVIDQIEFSDDTGWAGAYRERQFAACRELIDRQLRSETDAMTRLLLRANQTLATAALGRHEQAAELLEETLQQARVHIPAAAASLGTTMLGVLCAKRGDRAGAVAAYRNLHPDPEDFVSRISRPDAQIPFANL